MDTLKRYVDLSLFGTKHRKEGLQCLLERSGLFYVAGGDFPLWFQIFRVVGGWVRLGCLFAVSYKEAEEEGFQKMIDHSGFYCLVNLLIEAGRLEFMLTRKKSDHLLKTRQRICETSRYLDWEKEAAKNAEDEAWKFADYFWNIGILLLVICYMSVPVYLDFLVFLVYPQAPSLRIEAPFQRVLDAVGERNWANFAVSNVNIFFTALTIIAHWGIEVSFIFVLFDARNEMKMIERKLEILKQRMGSSTDVRNVGSTAENQALMKNIVMHHQFLVVYILSINDRYGFIMAAQDSMYSFIFCFITYSISRADKPASQLGSDGLVLLLMALSLFCVCRLGESLEMKMNLIRMAVYDLPWWDRDVDLTFKKSTLMMLRQTVEPTYLTYKNLYSLNLAAFQATLNTSYSLYMMLQTFS